MNATHDELRTHIGKLERRLRHLMAVIAVCVAALGLFLVSAFRGQDKPAQLLRATRIEVVNDKGEVVAVIDGESTTLRVGSEDDAHVTIAAERERPRSPDAPGRSAAAAVRVSNPRAIFGTAADGRADATISVDGSNAMVILGYAESPRSNPNRVWLMADPRNTSARLEHVSGSKATLFAIERGASWLSLGQGNERLSTVGVSSSGAPYMWMQHKEGKILFKVPPGQR